jgi:hypothetical protein
VGPSSRRAAKSTAYDTDMVEPLRASGRVTLKTDVMDDSATRTRKVPTGASVRSGR